MHLNNWRICDKKGVVLKWIETPDGKEYNTLEDFTYGELEGLVVDFWRIGWGGDTDIFDFDGVFSVFRDLFDKSNNPKKMKNMPKILERTIPNLVKLMHSDWYSCPNVNEKIGIYNSTWPSMADIKNKYEKVEGRYILVKKYIDQMYGGNRRIKSVKEGI